MSKDLSKLSLIVLDVDGTLTDGGVYISNSGDEFKKFNIKDGAGIVAAMKKGVDFMILTGRESRCVSIRAKELGIKYVFQGVADKMALLKDFVVDKKLSLEDIAYIGDDLNDIACMRYVGVSACPNDAVYEVRESCDYVMSRDGGRGAVREFLDLLLETKKVDD